MAQFRPCAVLDGFIIVELDLVEAASEDAAFEILIKRDGAFLRSIGGRRLFLDRPRTRDVWTEGVLLDDDTI
jgi:hypothetical protein